MEESVDEQPLASGRRASPATSGSLQQEVEASEVSSGSDAEDGGQSDSWNGRRRRRRNILPRCTHVSQPTCTIDHTLIVLVFAQGGKERALRPLPYLPQSADEEGLPHGTAADHEGGVSLLKLFQAHIRIQSMPLSWKLATLSGFALLAFTSQLLRSWTLIYQMFLVCP